MRRLAWRAAVCLRRRWRSLGTADAPGPARRLDAWRIVGPGGGGTMRRPAISPHDPQGRGRGLRHDRRLHHAATAAQSWRMFNLGCGARPRSPSIRRTPATIYAGARARSGAARTRAGRWRMVYPDPAQNTVEHAWRPRRRRVHHRRPRLPGQRARRGRSTRSPSIRGRPGAHLVAASAADSPIARQRPPSPTLLLDSRDRRPHLVARGELRHRAGLRDPRPSARVRTARCGRSARRASTTAASGGWQRYDAPGAGSASARAASAGSALGRRAAYATLPLDGEARRGRGRRAASPRTAAAPGGRRTARCSARVREARARARAGARQGLDADRSGRSPRPRTTALVAYVGLRGSAGGADGARRSTASRRRPTAGARWRVVHAEADRPSAEPRRLVDRAARRRGRPLGLVRLALRPRGGARAIPTSASRRTSSAPTGRVDGGKTWAQVNSARRGDDRWASRGLDVTNDLRRPLGPASTRSASSSPTPTSASSAARTAARPGPARSTRHARRAGATRPTGSPSIPRCKGLMWGAFSGTHDLPRPKMWRRTDPDTLPGRRRRLHGRRAHLDARRTRAWRRARSPTCSSTPRARRAAARSTRRAFGRGVYKSTDNGAHLDARRTTASRRPHQPFAWRHHARAGRHALPRGRAAQRARTRSATPTTARSTAPRTAPSTGRG